MKVHPDFRKLIRSINKEVDRKTNDSEDGPSYCQITKVITNLIKANNKIKNMLIKVIVDGGK